MCLVLAACALFAQERPAYITSLDLDVSIEPLCRARILREGVLGLYDLKNTAFLGMVTLKASGAPHPRVGVSTET
jgi:hypothetical protein